MWWYNTRIWANAGLAARKPTEPITYDELLDAAKSMTKTSGGKTSVYGLWAVTPDIDRIAAMAATVGGKIISADLATVDFTSPEAIKALTWIVEAGKQGLGYSAPFPALHLSQAVEYCRTFGLHQRQVTITSDPTHGLVPYPVG